MDLTTYDMSCLQKAKALIDADISRHLTIDTLATKTGIGTTKLKKGFKQLFKMGLYAYLKNKRMIEAAELLSDTDKTVKQIAKATGFRYTSNFNTAFRKFHDITPLQYRIKNK